MLWDKCVECEKLWFQELHISCTIQYGVTNMLSMERGMIRQCTTLLGTTAADMVHLLEQLLHQGGPVQI